MSVRGLTVLNMKRNRKTAALNSIIRTLQEEPKLEYHDKRTITSPVERCGYGLTLILECDYLQDSNMVKEVQTTNN